MKDAEVKKAEIRRLQTLNEQLEANIKKSSVGSGADHEAMTEELQKVIKKITFNC